MLLLLFSENNRTFGLKTNCLSALQINLLKVYHKQVRILLTYKGLDDLKTKLTKINPANCYCTTSMHLKASWASFANKEENTVSSLVKKIWNIQRRNNERKTNTSYFHSVSQCCIIYLSLDCPSIHWWSHLHIANISSCFLFLLHTILLCIHAIRAWTPVPLSILPTPSGLCLSSFYAQTLNWSQRKGGGKGEGGGSGGAGGYISICSLMCLTSLTVRVKPVSLNRWDPLDKSSQCWRVQSACVNRIRFKPSLNFSNGEWDDWTESRLQDKVH